MNILSKLDLIHSEISKLNSKSVYGKVLEVNGLLVKCIGIGDFVVIGSKCEIITSKTRILAEVIGFSGKVSLLMTFGDIKGIGVGNDVEVLFDKFQIMPDISWLGRVINGLGDPIDDLGPLKIGEKAINLYNNPPNPHKRKRVEKKIDLGVRAVNTFITCCYGQRMGIFAGSGVGKSVLISMMTKYAKSDVKIIGLIGERGREVQEFIQSYLGNQLDNTIIVVATGDEPALMRKQATYLTISLAEFFRDAGKQVLCIIDSITRFAMAQREIGLSLNEPPTTKGYTPTVFSELPKILERAGPGLEKSGDITGIFTVLVDGDDTNEPIADAVRGILDGHIVMDRAIAERGRFPAINILKSVSRTVHHCNTENENRILTYAKRIFANYHDMEEMIKIGAYKAGSNAEIDLAIKFYPQLDSFLSQKPDEHTSIESGYKIVAEILNLKNFL